MRKRINFLGFFLILLRLANIMYRVFSYQSISECIQSPQFVLLGIGIQIIAQLLSIKWAWASKVLSFIVVLTFLNMRFCENNLDPSNELAVLVDTLIFDIFCTLLLSYNWLLTSIGSFLLKTSIYEMLVIDHFETASSNGLIVYPLVLC